MSVSRSEGVFRGELNYPGVVAGRNDLAEVACVVDDASGVRIDSPAGLVDGVEIADWIGKVDVVQKVERFDAKLKIFRFAKANAPRKGDIHVELFRPSERIATALLTSVENACPITGHLSRLETCSVKS